MFCIRFPDFDSTAETVLIVPPAGIFVPFGQKILAIAANKSWRKEYSTVKRCR